jgi:hypothetical protein
MGGSGISRVILLGWLTGYAGMFSAVSLAEIPSGPDVPTRAQLEKRAVEFKIKTSVAAYQASGRTNPARDAQIIEFIGASAREMIHDTTRPTLAALERQARAIYLLDCNDPLVYHEYARIWQRIGRADLEERFARPAAETMKEYGYPANCRAFSARLALDTCLRHPHQEDAAKYAELLADGVEGIFTEHTYGDDRALLVFSINALVEGLPSPRQFLVPTRSPCCCWKASSKLPKRGIIAGAAGRAV